MKLAEYDISQTYKATILHSNRITNINTAEVRHIRLKIEDPTFYFIEGQSIAITVPGPHAFGNENHTRLYSIASPRNVDENHATDLSICVRRCFYIDEVSGERYPGVASNYLCDLKPGESLRIAGPFGRSFLPPRDATCNLLMIGVGTGIAPFRAFIKHVYDQQKTEWKGKVRLFYGARSGLDLLYLNDKNNDLANYYDQDTFKAFEALSPRPHLDEDADVEHTLVDNAKEVWELIQDPKTHVYVSGITRLESMLDKSMAEIIGSDEVWQTQKNALIADSRWNTLYYD